MPDDFRSALLWHMQKYGTSISKLSSQTGVSRDVIAKLRTRPNSTTTVENGIKIAAYYKLNVNQFVRCEEANETSSLMARLDQLSETERELLAAQVQGLLARSSGKPQE